MRRRVRPPHVGITGLLFFFFTVPHCAIHLAFFFYPRKYWSNWFFANELSSQPRVHSLQLRLFALWNLLRCWKEAKEKQARRQPSGHEGGKEKNKHPAQERALCDITKKLPREKKKGSFASFPMAAVRRSAREGNCSVVTSCESEEIIRGRGGCAEVSLWSAGEHGHRLGRRQKPKLPNQR